VIPVKVPDLFNLSQLLMYCKWFGIYFCKACKVPLSQKNVHVHLNTCEKGPVTWQQYGISQFPKTRLDAAIWDCNIKYAKYVLSPDEIAGIPLHCPVKGLAIHDVYVPDYCKICGCRKGALIHKKSLRQHLEKKTRLLSVITL